MILSKKAFPAYFLILLVFSVFPLAAQTTKPNFNRARSIDVQHYLIRMSFDRAKKMVFGETTVFFKPLKNNLNRLELDAAGLKFESVKLEPDNKDLRFQVQNEKVFVTLDKNYSTAETIKVRFKYSAMPLKGVYFVDAEKTGDGQMRDAQIWTQGETEEAHHWFPCFDFPEDKATSEQFLTVESGETAISNGELVETIENPDGSKTFHYKMNAPHPVYLTSFVIGKYARVTDSYKNIPLAYYLYPGKEALAKTAFGNTKEMMRIFEELTGVSYPFNKYDQTIVAKFNSGGMENITATTYADDQILFAEFDFSKQYVEDLVSHELAHSWFGNLVTCRNWAELWLNEGFATFMEAAYREKMNGRADYIRKIKSDVAEYFAEDIAQKRKHGLYNLLARPDDSIFDTVNYQKGGAVIHTLRETVGEQVFWKAVNVYLTRHKFGSVETTDLQKVFEETAGQDLDWFFNQWVFGAGYPKLEVKAKYDVQTKTLRLDIKQAQTTEDLTPAAFVLPLEIEIQTAQGGKEEKFTVRKRDEIVSIKLDRAPVKILIDKNEKIPLKTVKIHGFN